MSEGALLVRTLGTAQCPSPGDRTRVRLLIQSRTVEGESRCNTATPVNVHTCYTVKLNKEAAAGYARAARL